MGRSVRTEFCEGRGALRRHSAQRLCVRAQPETLIAKLHALISQYYRYTRGEARDGVAAVPLCRARQAARDSASVGSSRAGHGRQCAVPRAHSGASLRVSVRSHPPRPSAGPGASLGGGGIAWYSLRAPQGLRSSPGQCGGHGNAHRRKLDVRGHWQLKLTHVTASGTPK